MLGTYVGDLEKFKKNRQKFKNFRKNLRKSADFQKKLSENHSEMLSKKNFLAHAIDAAMSLNAATGLLVSTFENSFFL